MQFRAELFPKTQVAGQRPGIGGFTLVELLIALTILLILAALTVPLLNATLNSDRIRTGSRELQSYLAGARDRAIYSGQPRGVRLLADPANPSTVHSFAYIGASSSFTDGSTIAINSDLKTFTAPSSWAALYVRGFLIDGTPINLGGTLYSVARDPNPPPLASAGTPTWALTKVYAGTPGVPTSYTLQLVPSILPGDEPRTLPQGIVIDLNNCSLPTSWGSRGAYAQQLDILFSPAGTVIGTVASAGRIHFVLSDVVDTSAPVPTTTPATGVPLLDGNHNTWQATTAYALEQWVVSKPPNGLSFRCVTAGNSGGTQPTAFTGAVVGQTITDGTVTWQAFNPKVRLIVSLATATGRVTTSPVDPNDKFRFAEIGEVTQ